VSLVAAGAGTAGMAGEERAAYRVALPAFDGTLSELAHALRTERIAPEAIDLLALVRDFLGFFERTAGDDLDLASEALPAVAQVIELKVRLLLPRPPRHVDEEPEATRADAVHAVEMLERLESAIAFLRERRERRRFLVPARTLAPTFPRRERPLDLAIGALAKVAAQYRLGSYFELARDRLSLPDAMRRLLERLRPGGGHFATLAPRDWASRTVYFAALLELVKERRVRAQQETPFGPIELAGIAVAAAERGGEASPDDLTS
jgi:segregation and condensation protein A